MRKWFLPFRRMRLFAFYRGISTEPRVPRAPTNLSRLPFLSFALISHPLSPPSFLPPSPL
jgi:hypothetical protein